MEVEAKFLLVFIKYISEFLPEIGLISAVELDARVTAIIVCMAGDSDLADRLVWNIKRIRAQFSRCDAPLHYLLAFVNLTHKVPLRVPFSFRKPEVLVECCHVKLGVSPFAAHAHRATQIEFVES